MLVLLSVMITLWSGGIGLFHFGKTNAEDYAGYVMETVGVDLRDITKSSRGTIQNPLFGEPYGVIELELSITKTDEGASDLYLRLETAFGEQYEEENWLPSVEEEDILNALKEKTILKRYVSMKSGKRAKTRVIYIYIASDTNGVLYYYQFG